MAENKSLINQISNKFDDENKVIETKFFVCGENFSLFYIESLINKSLFTSGLIIPLEKFVKQNQAQNKQLEKPLFETIKDLIVAVSSVE